VRYWVGSKTMKAFKNPFNILSATKLKQLTLAVFLVLTFAGVVLSQTPTPTPPTREVIIQEIREYAERHVKNDKPMDTKFVIDLFEKDSTTLSRKEIAQIYEEEYTKFKLKKDGDIFQKIKNGIFGGLGWFAAFIFMILFVCKETLQKYLTKFIDSIIELIYQRISGIPKFWF